MQPSHASSPVPPPAVPATMPRKTPIDMSALKLKMLPSVRATLMAAGVLAQRLPSSDTVEKDGLRPDSSKAIAPPLKVHRRENRSSSSSSSSSSSDSDDSSSSPESSYSDSDSSSDVSSEHFSSSAHSEASDKEATLFDIAQSQGLVSKEALTQEEEDITSLAPPRPPIVRSFPSDVGKTLARYRERFNREENMIRIKDDNKAVSLGTSKINYIDPRIVCSWAKAHDVPINKIFSATIIKKFPWAMNAENFDF